MSHAIRAVVSAFLIAAPLGAQDPIETGKLVPSIMIGSGHFGGSAAISGDTAVIGAPETLSPRAYVFVRTNTTWTQQAVLGAGFVTAQFGEDVDVSGDTVVVGAPRETHSGAQSAGAVYVFVRSGTEWTPQDRLVSANPKVGELFGEGVALAGDTLVVGVPLEAPAGAAYVFTRSGTTWTERARLTPSNAQPSDRFGTAIDLEHGTLAIGVPYQGGLSQGAVHVFVGAGASWTEQGNLTAPGIPWLLGTSVSLSGERLIAGSPLDSTVAPEGGSARVFARDGTNWSLEDSLFASDAGNFADFGTDVELWGDLALVGAKSHSNSIGPAAGSAYLFRHDGSGWVETAVFNADESTGFDRFGSSVALEGRELLVGAETSNAGGTTGGAVYSFVTADPWIYCTAGTSTSGCQASIGSSGTPSASAPSGFLLTASSIEGAKDGIFFWSTAGRQAVPWGNSSSFRCVTPPVTRGAVLTGVGSAGQCDGTFAYDLTARWTSKPAQNPGPGVLVQGQLWYRDPFNTSNQSTSLSDAIQFGVCP